MPLAGDVPTFTLVAEYPPLSPGGAERQGTLTFTPIPAVLASAGAIYLGEENATLGASGSATKVLIACDAFADPFLWRVDEDIDGLPPRSYNISVPASAGTVHLGTLAETATLATDYVVVTGPRGPEGPAGSGSGGPPSGAAGGALTGTYPNPTLASATIAAFDATGAAVTAQSAAISAAATDATTKASAAQAAAVAAAATDATTKANTAQSAATSAAATDATSKVTAHVNATDPHADRAAAATALASHEADTTAVHGIADTSVLVLTSDSRLTNSRTPTAHAASHASAGSDPVTPAAIGAFTQAAADTLAGRVTNVETVTTDLNTLVTDAETRVAGVETRATALEAGRLVKASNLSDLANAATARTNLGLGTAATQASGAFDAAGAAAAALVSANAYTDLHAGGAAPSRKVRIKDDNLGGLPSAASWTVVVTSASTPLQCSIPAVAGDRIEFFPHFMYNGTHFLDWVILDSAGVISEYAAADPATPGTPLSEGNPALYPSLSFSKATSADEFTVKAGHIDGSGNVTIALAHQGTGAGLVYAHATYPWRLRVKNTGPEPA